MRKARSARGVEIVAEYALLDDAADIDESPPRKAEAHAPPTRKRSPRTVRSPKHLTWGYHTLVRSFFSRQERLQ